MSERVLTLLELHPTQQAARKARKRFTVLDCGRRWGKTEFEKDVCIDDYLLNGLPVGWWNPTYKNLADVWRDVTETLQPITKDKSEQEKRIELVTGGVLDMWSADGLGNSARGRKYALAVIDEAATIQNLMPLWNSVIRPMLVDLKGAALFSSTPNRITGLGFKQLYQLARSEPEEWAALHYTSYDNPYLDKQELDGMRSTMTEEAYREEILAEFIEGEGAVFRNIKAAHNAPKDDQPKQHQGHSIVAGLDWGKQNDFTALAVGCATCRREVSLERYNQIDYHFQLQRVIETSSKWGVRSLVAELNSIGQPMFEQLQRAGLPCVGFETTGSSKPPLIEALALALEQASPQFIAHDWAMAELEAYERKVNVNTGHATYSAPDGLHDDTVMARALMLRAMANAPRAGTSTLRDNPWGKR